MQVEVGNLPDEPLGVTIGHLILIDSNAAGYGWCIDGPTQALAASGRMDLLTVVAHELGNAMGFPEDALATSAVTSPILAVGARHLPAPGQVCGGAEHETKAHASDLPQPAAGTQPPPHGGVSPDAALPTALVLHAVTGARRVDRAWTSRRSAPSQSLPPCDSIMAPWDPIARAAGVGQPPQETGYVKRLRKRAALAVSVPREVSTSSVPVWLNKSAASTPLKLPRLGVYWPTR